MAGGFVFGNAGVRGYWPLELKESLIRAATMVGAESLRGGSDWRNLQPQPNEWKWAGEDEVVALAAKYGAQVQYLVAYGGAPWTKSPETLQLIQEKKDEKQQWRYPPRLDAWRNWTRTLAQRYKGKIRYYEIWNEPDIQFFKGTAEQYFELLKAAYEEIKAVDPNAIVMTGGFASLDHGGHNRKLLELTLREGQPYFDLHAHHRHGMFAQLQKQVDDDLIPLRQKFGVKEPLYFNETAVGREYEREYDMAVELPKRLAYVWSARRGGLPLFHDLVEGRRYLLRGELPDVELGLFSASGLGRLQWDGACCAGGGVLAQAEAGTGRWGFAFNGKGDFSGR